MIWSTDSGAEIAPGRPQDSHFRGNLVQAMRYYAEGRLGSEEVPLDTIDRIIAIGSINSPKQCMMKEVCAQRLRANTLQEKLSDLFMLQVLRSREIASV